MGKFPNFDSDFLSNIVFSVKKRSKSIKHKTSSYSLQKVIEKDGQKEYEKLEIDIDVLYTSVRIFFWCDRFAWIDIRTPSKRGWSFEWQNEGRIGGSNSQVILKAIEKTIELSMAPNKESIVLLDDVWRNIIFKGPTSQIIKR